MTPKQKTALIVCGLSALGIGGILLVSKTASAKSKDDESGDDVVVTTPDGTSVAVDSEAPGDEEPGAQEPGAEEPGAEEPGVQEPGGSDEPEGEPEAENPALVSTDLPERDLGTIPLKNRYYIVKTGDSPYKVAQAFTGDGNRWRELQKENPKYDFLKEFWTGMELKLPASWPDSPAVLSSTSPESVPSSETPPLVATETAPEHDPNGTIALAHELLMLEGTPDWKYKHQEAVAEWQKRVGTLVPDGKFGPKSALRMAEEVAILPYVRFWSHWDKNQGLKEYRDSLLELADKLESESPAKKAHAEGLRMSAAREKAQSFPSKPAPQPNSEKEVQSILDEIGADAADQAITSILSKVS
jgi:hypothetical protein